MPDVKIPTPVLAEAKHSQGDTLGMITPEAAQWR